MSRSRKIKRIDFLKRVSLLSLFVILGLFALSKFRYIKRWFTRRSGSNEPVTIAQVVKQTEKNYGAELDRLAKNFNLPKEYLKALVILEVGGRKPAPIRYEKGVFAKLKKLKKGDIKRYELLRKETISDASDEALKNLATSWGAFQIMGYKCVQLGVKVSDIRGEKSLYWGVKWINDEYGKYLRKGKFKDAFHIHNTGQRFPRNGKPRTYHPNYVPNGLKYMDMFKQLS